MRVHHLAMRTRDLERLERFYVRILGLDVRARHGERSVWLNASGTVLMLERAEANEPLAAPGTLELVAFAVNPRERAALEARLDEAGIAVEGRTEHTIYLRDPDGRRLGLSDYVFDTPA